VLKFDQSLFTGLGFGATSGIMATLGLIVGMETLTGSLTTTLAAIYIITFSDGLADSLGIHLSQETNKKITDKEVWKSTLYTLFFKVFIALSFTIPLILNPSSVGVILCIVWGYFLLGALSYIIAKRKEKNSIPIVLEHWGIMTFVLIVTYFISMYVR
jgi:vacuolar iron transporter family protein